MLASLHVVIAAMGKHVGMYVPPFHGKVKSYDENDGNNRLLHGTNQNR